MKIKLPKKGSLWTMWPASRFGSLPLRCYVVALLLGATNSWADVPDLICQETIEVSINPLNLKASELRNGTLYRFKAGKLFLSGAGRAEYFYNTVTDGELGRYRAGHKTLLFENDFADATFVHAHISDIRITRVSCSRMTAP
jgi:hypothetical protein